MARYKSPPGNNIYSELVEYSSDIHGDEVNLNLDSPEDPIIYTDEIFSSSQLSLFLRSISRLVLPSTTAVHIRDTNNQSWLLYIYNNEVVVEKTDYPFADTYATVIDDLTKRKVRLSLNAEDEVLCLVEDDSIFPVPGIVYTRDRYTGKMVRIGVEGGQIYLQFMDIAPGKKTFKFKLVLVDTVLLNGAIKNKQKLQSRLRLHLHTTTQLPSDEHIEMDSWSRSIMYI